MPDPEAWGQRSVARPSARGVLGPTLTLLVVLVLTVLSQSEILRVPNPGVVLALAVFFAGYLGGAVSGAVSGGIALVYAALFYSVPGSVLRFEGDDATRFVVVALALVPAGVAGGLIHRRLERDRAVIAQREQELIRGLIASLQDGLVLTDERLVITEINPRMTEMTGFTREDLIGRSPPYPYWADENRATHEHFLERTLAGESAEYDVECQTKSGERLSVIFSRSPLRDFDGRITGTVTTLKDVTERKRAEERLLDSEELYRSVTDTASDGIVSIDEQSRITFVNRAAETIFGYAADEMLGRPLTMLMPPDLRPVHLSAIGRYLRTGERRLSWEAIELRGLHRDGHEIPVEVSFGEVARRGRRVFTGVIRDVTERRQTEEALRHSEEQLRQAQKMEAVGRLAGGVAHDFNNLLTAINGYTELILGDLGPDDPLREEMLEIQKAAESATALTRQLLAFSRRQVLEMRVLDLNEVIAALAPLLARVIGEDITLRTVLTPDLRPVKADRSQLEQVVMNLAVNARDAMPHGGRLIIETRNVDFDDADAREHLDVNPGRYVMLAVTDTGTGMDAETQARIFEPFFTTKERGKGTGLGLSTVYGIVVQSAGTIWVYSEPGVGTTFKIYFPEAVEEMRRPEPLIRPAVPAGGSETILLVEDDPAVRGLAEQVLSRHGYGLLVAPTPALALDMAREHGERIDLLVTDVIMPGMTGRELAGQLRAVRPELDVLFMSGYTEDAVAGPDGLMDGAEFLPKPFTPDGLARKVRAILDGRPRAASAGNGAEGPLPGLRATPTAEAPSGAAEARSGAAEASSGAAAAGGGVDAHR